MNESFLSLSDAAELNGGDESDVSTLFELFGFAVVSSQSSEMKTTASSISNESADSVEPSQPVSEGSSADASAVGSVNQAAAVDRSKHSTVAVEFRHDPWWYENVAWNEGFNMDGVTPTHNDDDSKDQSKVFPVGLPSQKYAGLPNEHLSSDPAEAVPPERRPLANPDHLQAMTHPSRKLSNRIAVLSWSKQHRLHVVFHNDRNPVGVQHSVLHESSSRPAVSSSKSTPWKSISCRRRSRHSRISSIMVIRKLPSIFIA